MTDRWRAYAAAAVVALSAGLGLLSVAPASAAPTVPVSVATASAFATPSSIAALAAAPLLITPAPTTKPASDPEADVKKNVFALQSMNSSTALILLISLALLVGAIIAVVRSGSTHRAH